MINSFCKFPLWKCSDKLCDVAEGRVAADTVVKGATLINVCTHEYLPDTDVAIACGRIAMVGDCSHCIGANTLVIDGKGKYLAPAFMDGHIHIESSMITAGEYARAVVPHGTSGIFMDPHEICNVLGLDGVKFMLEDASRTPLKCMHTTPSCVPAVPGFEDTGAEIGPKEVAETMTWKETVGLGEMMNFPGVIYSDKKTHAIIGETLKAGKTVTGHYSIPETGKGLNAYIAAGVRCCHESTRAEDALAKMRLGMYAMLREGSAWHDLKVVSKAITEHKVDSRFACLISDDAHPHTLIEYGHLDHIVSKAIEYGIDPITAIQMVTINVAQCFQLDHEMGSVTPSKCADLVLIDDLTSCHVTDVIIDGEYVAKDGELLRDFPPYSYPAKARDTVKVKELSPSSFKIKRDGSEATIRVIEVIPGRTSTIERIEKVPINNGEITAFPERDIMKAFVFERHRDTGKYGYGFVKGFGIKKGALAQTVAHDAHNLLVIGTDDKDMALAANTLRECGGGLVAVADGRILGLVPLPIAGLMSDRPLEEMGDVVSNLERAWVDMGCTLPSPFMTTSIISLACLPELRLTDRGLVDCRSFSFVEPIIE